MLGLLIIAIGLAHLCTILKIALLFPGFSAHEHDWCIPALLELVRSLSAVAEVHVFTLRWPERLGRYPVFNSTVHALGGHKRMGARVLGLWARAWHAIRTEHQRRPFTALHAFWADEPGWLAAWIGPQLNLPVTISLAGGELLALREIGYGLRLLPGRTALVRWALARATYITAGSYYLLELARAFLPPAQYAKLRYAPLGVDIGRFSPRFSPGATVDREAMLLNVGSLLPVKNQALALQALTTLPPTAALHIAGEGPLQATLQAQAHQLGLAARVQWLGAVAHDALPTVYRRARVLIQTSHHEAQGMAVLEAAACGVPVIGIPTGVLPEVGFVTRNAVELCAQLPALWANPTQRQTLGEVGRAQVEKYFSLGAALKRWVGMYRESVNSKQ